jgi:hypothetical protein
MVGIVCMIAGSYVVGMSLGFYCSPATAATYLGVEACLLAFAMQCVSRALADPERWIHAYLSMGAAVAFGALPLFQIYVSLTQHADLKLDTETLFRWGLGMFGNYFLGAFLVSPFLPLHSLLPTNPPMLTSAHTFSSSSSSFSR